MNNQQIQTFYEQLIELAYFFNQPQNDQALIKAAHVQLDYKLFPLFATIARQQPTNVQNLALFLGASHSTISRQLDRLEHAKLITTQINAHDSRKREVQLSELGQTLNQNLTQTRLQTIKHILNSVPANKQLQILDDITLLNHAFKRVNQENQK